VNEKQKRAAFDLLEGARRMTKAARDNRAQYLRHHCGWLVSAIIDSGTEIDLFATKQSAETAARVLRKFGAHNVQCFEATFTADEYDIVMGD